MATLPMFTKTIDNAFLQTWYEIRPDAIDNILNATVIWAALKDKGCFKDQVGGNTITRTLKYSTASTLVSPVQKGDTLPMGEVETETMAIWKWRYLAVPVQRSIIDDQQNSGKFRIKSYITQRMEEAREAMQQQYETDVFRAADTTEAAHKYIQSLNDVLVPYTSRATGTYGGVARSNTWWQNKYKAFTAPTETNLISDMKSLYNSVGNNQSYPDLIITSQTIFELYEDFALDQSQIVKSGTGPLADLGFETLKFKGQDMIWTPNCDATVRMYNTRFIEVIKDPNLWFQMSEFKPVANQMERVAHIISTANIITTQPRRHGLLY